MSLEPQDLQSKGDQNSQYPALILNQLIRQPRSGGQGGLPSHGGLHYIPNRLGPGNNGLLAAAVQQRLVASLASSNLPLLQPIGLTPQQAFVNDLSSARNILPQQPHNAITQAKATAPALNLLPMAGRQRADLQRDLNSNLRDTGKDSFRRVSTTQIPCQARGMSTDHNSLTAYFEIPSDATHGQHLYCSHLACRAAGVKFRYCLHCKKPVTKQNFRSRHLHADLEKPTTKSKPDVVPIEEKLQKDNQEKRALPLVCPPTMSEDLAGNNPNIADGATGVAEGTGAKSASYPKSEHVRKSSSKIGSAAESGKAELGRKRKQPCSASSPVFNEALSLVARRRRWASLLSERPSKLNAINEWLSRVITVSDPSSPFPVTGATLMHGTVSAKASIQQQAQWDELLAQRPFEIDSQTTEWLARVLKVSCPDFDTADADKTEPGKLLHPPPAPATKSNRKSLEEKKALPSSGQQDKLASTEK